ncbi:MAG: inositol monophosphatase, partial [Oscillospiraceae bacterium]|nr:inositol monophosphatase [Oscillospiraceae bacterium]
PYIGVIYNPYRDEVFYAQKGQGCYVNGRRVTVSDRDFAHSHLCSAMCLYNKGLAKP